jgi:hypothetical protein
MHPYTEALVSAVPVPNPSARPAPISWCRTMAGLTMEMRRIEIARLFFQC